MTLQPRNGRGPTTIADAAQRAQVSIKRRAVLSSPAGSTKLGDLVLEPAGHLGVGDRNLDSRPAGD